MTDHSCSYHCDRPECIKSQRDELRTANESLHALITKLHAAKGRYHTQLAACGLFDACGLKNERPVK